MATSTSGNDIVVVTIQRSCAKQLLVALTLALGGTPVRMINNKKGKGKGKGGSPKSSGTSAKTAATTSSKTSASSGGGSSSSSSSSKSSGGKKSKKGRK